MIEHFPGLVPAAFGSPWGYAPVGPYRVQVWHEDLRPEDVVFDTWVHLRQAVPRFAQLALPVRPGLLAFVLDESGRVVIGYSAQSAEARRALGLNETVLLEATIWYGMEIGFESLRDLGVVDELELTMWESMAMASAS